MNIVVLDGYTLNPGDLSWDGLRALGQCHIHDRTLPGAVRERAQGAELVLTNKTLLPRLDLEALPVLKYIGVLATGYNVVDLAAARERGVVVTNVPAYSTRAVAQLTFALLLELAHHAGLHAQSVREGRWCQSRDFCYWETPLLELEGLTFGIVGFGRIGQTVAQVAAAFGMNVLVCSRRPTPSSEAFRCVDLETLFREADVLSLHCPLTPATEGLVNAARLRLMKPTAFLINTGRGPLVVERDLADALNRGQIAGAGLDVLCTEPPPASNPLLTARNCCITPHIAWAAQAARRRLMDIAVENIRAFLAGRPQNVVC